jgi:hypothetical protein
MAVLLGTLGSALCAWASPPCPDGNDTCAGRPECASKQYDHNYNTCSTVTSNSIPWCCHYSVVVYTCGGGGFCSVSSLSGQSSPCQC